MYVYHIYICICIYTQLFKTVSLTNDPKEHRRARTLTAASQSGAFGPGENGNGRLGGARAEPNIAPSQAKNDKTMTGYLWISDLLRCIP